MKKNKILLSCPTYDGKAYCLDYWAETIKKLQKVTPCDVLLVDNSKGEDYSKKIRKYGFKVIKSKHYKKTIKSIGEAKKKLNNYLIKNDYVFHFSLEQDIFPDRNLLEELLKDFNKIKEDEAIIAAPYYYGSINDPKKHPFRTLGYISCIAKGLIYSKRYKRKIQNTMLSKELKNKKGLIKIFAAGFGCCLIPVSIIKKIKVKYSENNFKPDDAFFYQDCEKLGIPVYADVDLIKKVKHIPGSNAPESNGLFSWTSKKKKRNFR
jgi:hypothetical protein